MKNRCEPGQQENINSDTKEGSLPFWLFLFYEGDTVVQILLEHLRDTFEEPKGQSAIQKMQDKA